jgi:transposase
MISVGVDVHVRNSYFRVKDQHGRTVLRGRCGNSLAEFAEFLAPLERQARASAQPIRAVLESTTNSRPIALMLQRYGQLAGVDLTAQVLDARKLRIIAESTCKCDALDAEVLCDLAASNFKLPVCYLPDDAVFALREHLRARADLVRMQTMLKNRIHAVLHRRGILRPAQLDLFSVAGQRYLDDLPLDEAGRAILGRYRHCLDQLRQVIQASTAALRELAKQPRWRSQAALLQSMPGVGLITSLVILAELGDLSRFRSRASVANYAGLVPRVRDSNEKHYHGGISHRGSSHLRAVLVEAAWMAVGKAPQYADLYTRVQGRKGKAVAIVAVARRLLEDAWTVLRKNEAFRYVPASRPEVAASVAG